MNSENFDDMPGLARDFQDRGEEIAAAARQRARAGQTAAENYIRGNPLIAVGGALLAGVVIGALVRPSSAKPKKLEAVRGWLEDAYDQVSSQLPASRDVRAAVSQLPGGWKKFLKNLKS